MESRPHGYNLRTARKRTRKYEQWKDSLVSMKKRKEYTPFPFLALPREIQFKVFSHFDPASRRVMRENGILEGMEMKVKYRYGAMEITARKNGVRVSCDGGKMKIPHSEVEKEFEILGKNSYFESIEVLKDHRECVQATRFLKAKKITLKDSLELREISPGETQDPLANYIESIVQNKEEVVIEDAYMIGNVYMWIYEKMRDRQLDVKVLRIETDYYYDRLFFMEDLGDFDDNKFTTSNPNLKVINGDDEVCIIQGNLKIHIVGITHDDCEQCYYDAAEDHCEHFEFGYISFEIIEKDN